MGKKEQMRQMREQGFKHREIAERFGVSRQYAAHVCGYCDPAYFVPIGDECIYPNLRNWMNTHKVSRKEFLRRLGLTAHSNDYERLLKYMTGKQHPRKPYIDKMLAVTGMTYETLFYMEVDDG